MNRNDKKKVFRMDEQTWRIVDNLFGATVYSYLLCGRNSAVLLDTGMGLTNFKGLTNELTSLPVTVLNTHGHLDHISSNHQYEEVFLHPADEPIILQHSQKEFRLNTLRQLLAEAKMPGWLLELPGLRGLVERYASLPECNRRKPLFDGMRFDLGGRTLEVIATPGHTPGSVCLLDIERRQIYTGDTCCAQGVLLMFDHSCSVSTFRDSILRLKAASDRFDLNWPAHHQTPLDHSWMDDYLGCVEQILSGAPAQSSIKNPLGNGLLMKNGRIAITYRPDHL
ncbi:MAG: MBL fold metallo-hydrolase [Anaerolineales bacterium]|nr:MBL fold metallo-hydrolase [Anaerolineales bacterium]